MAITIMKPTTIEPSTAFCGVPLPAVLLNTCIASRRVDSEYSMREAVYSAEFRQLATEISTTTSTMALALGMPISSSVRW
ncbi:hypothetical protein D3C72_2215920 [compost metagenome]